MERKSAKMTVATQALKIAVIADDLTGSADTGVQFCSVVGPVYLTSLGDADFELASEGYDSTGISINTNSRHVSRAEAAARVKMAVTGLRASGLKAEIIYKKIDSSLRGNIGAELDAILAETGAAACFVAPALPVQGRTTESDIHRVHGIPVAETESAKDPLCPVSESRLSVHLQDQSELKVGHVTLATTEREGTFAVEKVKGLLAEGCRHISFDAIDDRHLDRIAELGMNISKEMKILFCGSAALAASLTRLINPGSFPRGSEMSGGKEGIRQKTAKWLMVCGSASDIARLQIDRLVQSTGWEHRVLGCELLLADGSSRENSLQIKEFYESRPAGNAIISIDPKSEYPSVDPKELVSRFATIGGKLAITTKPEILFLTGGDTAEAVLKKIGCAGIKLYREVLPGLVQGELCGGPLAGSIIVTKAGSFGEEDTLVKLVQQLSLETTQTARNQQTTMKNNKKRPILGITIGDPGGVGPEVCVKALQSEDIYDRCCPLVIGDAGVVEDAIRFTGLSLGVRKCRSVKEAQFIYGTIDVLDLANLPLAKLQHKTVTAAQGQASFDYVVKAIELALGKEIDATVTGPINKGAINAAGIRYAGHTEIYADKTDTRDYAMMLAEDDFRVTHVSTHVSLRKACDRVKKDRVLRVIRLTDSTLKGLGIESPRIAVAGLNPHCSEDGLFGWEEQKEIIPAIKQALAEGIGAEGPLPADTVFSKMRGGMFDAVVVMYHDQGHIPTKLVGFQYDEKTDSWGQMAGINVTLGLPIIRTSVDHGTAFDRAGENRATPQSMIEAIEMAILLARN